MPRNMGSTDRIVRAVAAVVLVVVLLQVGVGSALGVVLIVLAALLAGTAAVGFCPLYKALHLSTRPADRVAR
ncbi:hypothetical protein CELL_01020 [Cellulomonas sp. T2.31MG-18]|uniref:YgaP-like transmembrane domain n=1 Tax=unclassified Cellulomonas TaxID=2620175 RepID=UPI003081B79C|nr:hypothetical protein CELD12_25430 [Cellulomonas sp. NTE-D12]